MRAVSLCLAFLLTGFGSSALANFHCTTTGTAADICSCHNSTDCSAMRKSGMCKDSMSCTAAGTCTCTAKLVVDGGGRQPTLRRPDLAAPRTGTLSTQ